jgi:hypothetical protein
VTVTRTPPEPTLVPNEEDYDAVPSPRRVMFARVVIALTAVVTLTAFALIFYRSITVSDPSSAIVIVGDASLDGAQILVTSGEFPDAHATLSAANGYQTPVLLHPGIYSVVVTHKDRVLLRRAFRLESHRGLVFPLELFKAAQTQPTTAAATRAG